MQASDATSRCIGFLALCRIVAFISCASTGAEGSNDVRIGGLGTTMTRWLVLSLSAVLVTAAPAHADETGVIATMDEMRFQPPKEKGSAGLVEGKVGKAVR